MLSKSEYIYELKNNMSRLPLLYEKKRKRKEKEKNSDELFSKNVRLHLEQIM